jgi:hypothetical protein
MHPYAHKTSFLSKSSRKETTCIDGTEAVFAPLLGALVGTPPMRSRRRRLGADVLA